MARFCLHDETDRQVAVADIMAIVRVGDDACGISVDENALGGMNDNDENDIIEYTRAYTKASRSTSSV